MYCEFRFTVIITLAENAEQVVAIEIFLLKKQIVCPCWHSLLLEFCDAQLFCVILGTSKSARHKE